jgi:RNA polymerase sigma factor (sigma-70 family)
MQRRRNQKVSAKNANRGEKVRTQKDGFIIPESVCQLQLDELPITARLANVVRSVGIRTVGDLNRRSVCEVLQWKNCGGRTLREIQQLIERAISGEFDTKQVEESMVAAELLTLLEQGMLNLPPRESQFLFARLGGLSYKEIGRQCGLTRARVHQAVSKTLETIRKTYGPRIPRLLEMLKRRSLSMPDGLRLTPLLLEQWVGLAAPADDSASPAVARRLSREAQLRLITSLDKRIPCCLEKFPKRSATRSTFLPS